jgi:hypothetical protein
VVPRQHLVKTVSTDPVGVEEQHPGGSVAVALVLPSGLRSDVAEPLPVLLEFGRALGERVVLDERGSPSRPGAIPSVNTEKPAK